MRSSKEIAEGGVAHPNALAPGSIGEWLAAERGKELLRFSTAGSVDDGKSTLVGRLLYDSKNLHDDHVQSVTRNEAINFAQLTDGLRAEREQGITIDVAYRYFSTAKRKFIIADTPGHEQYTRNMATGASTADVAVVLIDARKGILPQTRRHLCIAALLGIRLGIVAVNKMDLVNFSEEVFESHRNNLMDLKDRLGIPELIAIPVCALDGDNVVDRSARMPWYNSPKYAGTLCAGEARCGASLLELLDAAPLSVKETRGFRFPVQCVVRPHQDFRGFAGQIAAGRVSRGDEVVILPSGIHSRVERIGTWNGDLESACAPRSVTLSLADDVDVSRGNMIASPHSPPHETCQFDCTIVWMHAEPLREGQAYLLKHTTQTVKARVKQISSRFDIERLEHGASDRLVLNEIGHVALETARPIYADLYTESRATGSFILIDPSDNSTAGAGMVRRLPDATPSAIGDHGALIELGNRSALAAQIEESLLEAGALAVRTRVRERTALMRLARAGAIVLREGDDSGPVEITVFDRFSNEVTSSTAGDDVARSILQTIRRA